MSNGGAVPWRILGTKKCRKTRAAIRFCRERSIDYQFADLLQHPLTEGELRNMCRGKDPQEFIDRQGAYYVKQGYEYREFDAFEELCIRQELLATPIVIAGGRKASDICIAPGIDELDALYKAGQGA
jgi:arsenate reductase (glutaredoxin)